MLDRTHRFHGYNSLRQTYKYGQTTRSAQLSLKFRLNNRRATYRAAVVVSRKVNKSAVVRNRLRRRIYETIQHYQTDITKPYDLIFTVFGEQLGELSLTELDKLVHSQLLQARIITPSARGGSRGIVGLKEN